MDGGQQTNVQVPPNLNGEDCYKAAQGERLPDISSVCNPEIREMVVRYRYAIGCPEEYIFLPLISSCAALMGTRTKIIVSETWTEPPILWTIIGAKPGTRKTAALQKIMAPLLSVLKDRTRHWHMANGSSSGDNLVSHTKVITGTTCASLRELDRIIMKNNGQILCITENMEHFHKTLEMNENKDKFHDWYDGLASFGVNDGEISTVENTCFNQTGFARPEYIVDLHLTKPAWICGRYLVSCPDFPTFSLELNSACLPNGGPSVKALFQTLQSYHQQDREYVFSDAARKELKRCHEYEWIKMISQLRNDKNRTAVIEKSLGQIVRIAGVFKAMFNACQFTKHAAGSHIAPQGFQWDLTIDRDTLCRAIEMVKYFVDQKLSLMMITGFNFGRSLYTSGHIAMNVKESLRQYHCQQQQNGRAQHQNKEQQPQQPYGRSRHQQHHVQVVVQHSSSSGESAVSCLRGDSNSDLSYGEGSESQDGEPQTAEFVHMDKTTFLSAHGSRIRRLLECYDDGTGVSATTASQKSITPSVKLQSSNNRHPVWASALFFQKCQELGLGSAEQVKHPTNRKFYWRFKRKRVADLDDKHQQLLNYLRVDMSLYSRIGQQLHSLPSQYSSSQLPLDLIENLNDSTSHENSVDDNIDNTDVEIIIKEEPM